MNLNRLVRMFAGIVMHRVLSWGINKGFGKTSRSGQDPRRQQKHKTADTRKSQKRIRQAMRMLRRIGR